MMAAVQLYARTEDGRILIDLPREHLALANAEFLVLLVPDAAATPLFSAGSLQAHRLGCAPESI